MKYFPQLPVQKFVITMLLILTAWFSASSGASDNQDDQAVKVVVHRTFSAPVYEQYRAIGTVKSQSQVRIANEFPGRIRWIIREGMSFEAGDKLAVFDTTLAELQLKESRQTEQALDAELKTALLKQQHAEKLRKTQHISEHDFQLAVYDVDNAQSQLAAQRTRTALITEQIRRMTITAQRAGIVVSRHQNTGEYLRVGDIVLTTIDLSDMTVSLELPQKYLALFDAQTAWLSFNSTAGRGQLAVAGVVPVGRNAFSVISESFNGFNFGLTHDSTLDVDVVIPGKEPLLWMHRDALINTGTEQSMDGQNGIFYIDNQGNAAKTDVTVLARRQAFVAVRMSEQLDNVMVIVRGMERVKMGERVKIASDISDDIASQYATTRQARIN